MILIIIFMMMMMVVMIDTPPRRDVAAPPDDALGDFFPVARCKDLYDGHSWASGLFQMADGKSQESSSESTNAYYAAVLVAEIIGDAPLLKWAQLLLATEVRAVQWYWHVPSNSRVYDEKFVANNRLVAVRARARARARLALGAVSSRDTTQRSARALFMILD
jgi:hypothetical protein